VALIAAAPDLLAALEAFASFEFHDGSMFSSIAERDGDSIVLCGYVDGKPSGINVMLSDFTKAKAAIAKAKGAK
jgi:hypothetical protein